MSRAGEHTPLSPDKGDTQSDERESERNSKQPAGDGDQQKGTHCGHQQAAVMARGTPGMQDDTTSRGRLSEAPCTRSDYGSVDAVTVCQSCQHLYAGANEVVLSPSHLERDAFTPRPASPTSHKGFSMHRPWTARRYEGLCDCGATVSGGACVCPGRTTSGLMSNSSPCLRKVKIAALVLAALLPWAFLVAYVVLYYT